MHRRMKPPSRPRTELPPARRRRGLPEPDSRSGEPTLLVFTLGATCESRRRHLLPAEYGAIEERLHRACLDAALAAGRAAGCRVEVSAPERLDVPPGVRQRTQQGCGFAARFGDAVRGAFAASDGAVVVVGSDVPGLEAAHIRRALELLDGDPGRVVVGPSPDGGFYLLASAEPLDGVFASVHWCCGETLESLRRALAQAGRDVTLLPPLVDLDRRRDLERWLAGRPAAGSRAWRVLLAALTALLAALRGGQWRTAAALPPRTNAVRVPPLRAPPASA